jgi:mevalonate kinase
MLVVLADEHDAEVERQHVSSDRDMAVCPKCNVMAFVDNNGRTRCCDAKVYPALQANDTCVGNNQAMHELENQTLRAEVERLKAEKETWMQSYIDTVKECAEKAKKLAALKAVAERLREKASGTGYGLLYEEELNK